MQLVNVNVADNSYPIYIGERILQNIELLQPHIHGNQIMVVSNETLAPLYLEQITSIFYAYQCNTVILPDGEQYKSLESLQRIFDALLAKQHHRNTTLVALGGGVIGDITGFAAACYQRGANLIQIPTTLLAQVDAAIGGKTAVNHPLGKNMIGTIYQPRCVIADLTLLQSLPEREFNAGFAEIIKYALICDREFFAWLEANIQQLLTKNIPLLSYAIQRCCEIKAEIVVRDEKEQGDRILLNFGHTVGHAIEGCLGYGHWRHGEAVAVGMVIAAKIAEYKQLIPAAEVARIVKLLKRAHLPTRLPRQITLQLLQEFLAVDKKIVNNSLKWILLKNIGTAVVTSDVSSSLLKKVLKELVLNSEDE